MLYVCRRVDELSVSISLVCYSYVTRVLENGRVFHSYVTRMSLVYLRIGAFFTRVTRVLYIYLNSVGICIRQAIRVHRKTDVLKNMPTYAAYHLHASDV